MLTFDRMFQSGMLLQRQKPVARVGEADPGAKILISFRQIGGGPLRMPTEPG